MIELLDTTIREGEQTNGVSFTIQQKIEIAKMLDDFGVEFIEVGHPAISKVIYNDVKVLANLGLRASIVGHARARKDDIDKVLACGCEWVGIFMGINELSFKHKYHITKEEAVAKFLDSLAYAKRKGLKVRCSIEDGSRTPINDWIKMARDAQHIGVERLSFVDTVGCMTPRKIFEQIKTIKTMVEAEINVHCHNDLGMAVANSIAAFEAGAKCIDVTVNGLGERAGLTSLSTVTAALNVLYNVKKWDMGLITKISRIVEKYSGIEIPQKEPVVGEYVFTHKGGLHAMAVLENPDSYEILHPQYFGNKRKIVIGSFSGKRLFAEYLKSIDRSVTEQVINKEYCRLKNSMLKDIIWEI